MSSNTDFSTFFFVGKGGVGKTTSAAISALHLSKQYKTLIVSLDPAHNVGDVFDVKLDNSPKRITNNLDGMEVDLEKEKDNYLKESSRKLKSMYNYLDVINLTDYLDTLKHSPGMEEYATLEAIEKILSKKEYEVIIFDTPPTGLTLRVLTLPEVSMTWTKKLLNLRKEILDRRQTIENVTGEKKKFVIDGEEIEYPTEQKDDAITQELKTYAEEIEKVKNILTDNEKSKVIMVMNPDELSLYETERAIDTLSDFKINIEEIIINEYEDIKSKNEIVKKVETKFKLPMTQIPKLEEEPKGMDKIKETTKYIENKDWIKK